MDDRAARQQRRREIDALVREALRAEASGEPLRAVVVPEPTERTELPASPATDQPSAGHPRRRRLLAGLVVALVVAAVGAVALRTETMPVRLQVMLGLENRQPAKPTVYDDGVREFRNVQPRDPELPIGYNPCRTVPVSMNFADAPSHAEAMVMASIRRINAVSGLRLEYVGATEEVATTVLAGPVVITWNPTRGGAGSPGRGWSDYRPSTTGLTYYHSGAVMMANGPFEALSRDRQQAEVDRAMAQVVGLGEVDGGRELMSLEHEGRTTFGHGDLTGLAMLGRLPCG
jgi:hypothetical protein